MIKKESMKNSVALPSSAYFDILDSYEKMDVGIKRMKQHGFDSIDYQGFAYDTVLNWSESEFLDRMQAVLKVCSNNGICVFQAHGPSRWPAPDNTEEDRAEIFEKMSKSIRGTALLECKYLVLHPIMPFGTGKIGDEEARLTREINVEYFCRLDKVAREYGVVICLENLPFRYFPLSPTAEILDVVRQINSPNVRICLDTGHSAMLGDPAYDIRLAGQYISTVHLHDNNGHRDEHKMPFAGSIDWDGVCRALCDVNFNGALNFETWAQGNYPAELKEYMENGFSMAVQYVVDMFERFKQDKIKY